MRGWVTSSINGEMRWRWLGACAFALAALLLPATAAADVVHPLEPFSPLDGSGSGVTLHTPGGIAVDEASGNVFLDDGAGGESVAILGGEGAAPAGLAAPFTVPGFKFVNEPSGAAFDNATTSPARGTLYVADTRNRKLKKLTRNAATERYEVTGELVSTPALGELLGVAVDTQGNVFVADFNNKAVVEFDSSGAEVNRISTATAVPPQGRPSGVAVDAAGDLFVQGFNAPRPVMKWSANSAGDIEAGTVPVKVQGAEGATGVGVDPATNTLYVVFENHVATYDATTLEPQGEFGGGILAGARRLAVNAGTGRIYVSDKAKANIAVFGSATIPQVRTEAATQVSAAEATLNGSVNPEGQSGTECRFEYGTSAAYGSSVPCTPSVLPADETTRAVFAALSGLAANTTYHFRIVAANANGIESRGEDATFTTLGPPQITEELPIWVEKTAATLRAKVNPSGFASNYRFEWGTDTSYGHRVPADFDPSLGSGTQSLPVTAQLSGLAEGTRYHFRVVATSTAGTTVGEDHEFETVNACGLVGRCFELVSPADKGPVASAGKPAGISSELGVQVAPDGESLAYVMEAGLPDATSGDEVLYMGRRGGGGWTSEQITPPNFVASEISGANSIASRTRALSEDLSCGTVATPSPLAPEAPTSTVEAGGSNLYRRDNRSGMYSLISVLPVSAREASGGPLTADEYLVLGMSGSCERGFFRSFNRYPGIPGVGLRRVYEWDHGTLRPATVIEGSGGAPESVEALPGSFGSSSGGPSLSPTGNLPADIWRAVSADGSRLIFTAVSRSGGDLGQFAVFVRSDGGTAVDVSQSQTESSGGPANTGPSRYWTASRDGSKVYFTARYGLATNGTSSGASSCSNDTQTGTGVGCDLYRYSLGDHQLIDISADPNPADVEGAGVVSVLGASDDGSYVSYATRGQLVIGPGRTEAENKAQSSFNVYLAHVDPVTHQVTTMYAGLLNQTDLVRASISTGRQLGGLKSTAVASPDGRYLLFESSADITGYASGGAPMVYRYSVADDQTVCVSCRRDGQPSVAPSDWRMLTLAAARPAGNMEAGSSPFAMSGDGGRVFFRSPDRLASGALHGANNLYEWQQGQIALIATEPGGLPSAEEPIFEPVATPDGRNVFFATPEKLNWEDVDGRSDVYDARVGGGFPPRTTPLAPCDPAIEGSCQTGPGVPVPGPAPASSTFAGPGNENPKKKSPKRKHHRKHRRCTPVKGKNGTKDRRCKGGNGKKASHRGQGKNQGRRAGRQPAEHNRRASK